MPQGDLRITVLDALSDSHELSHEYRDHGMPMCIVYDTRLAPLRTYTFQ